MRIYWSPHARAQAREIFSYIAQDRPEAAHDLLHGFIERVGLLGDLPQQGEVVPGTVRGDLRIVIYRSYRIVYRLRPTEIAILSVRHTRMQPQDSSPEDDR